jgi:hypothetical protein
VAVRRGGEAAVASSQPRVVGGEPTRKTVRRRTSTEEKLMRKIVKLSAPHQRTVEIAHSP